VVTRREGRSLSETGGWDSSAAYMYSSYIPGETQLLKWGICRFNML